MALDSKEKTIHQLYSDSCYKIPDYQRGYAWGKSNVEQLISDLQEAIVRGKDFYFLSSLTVCLESDSSNEKTGYEFVIDGQQRLITISLVMKVLMNILDKNSFIRTQLVGCIKKSDSETKLYLDNEEDRENFEKYILDEEIKDTSKKINEAYNVIKKIIEEENHPADFAKFLLDNTYVVKNIVMNEEHACQIFESLNDRGVPLTAFDLIKNRLFLLSLDKEDTRESILNIQTLIQGFLGNGRTLSPNTRDYFRVYLQVNKEDKKDSKEINVNDKLKINFFVDNGGMYKKFKNQIKDSDSAKIFIENLKNKKSIKAFLSLKGKGLGHVRINSIIENMANTDHLKHYFNGIYELDICQPVLFALFFHMDENQIKDTLKDLYCLVARTKLLHFRPSKIQDMLAKIASQMYRDSGINFSDLLKDFLEDKNQFPKIKSSDYIDNFKATLEGNVTIDVRLSKDILFDICLLSNTNPMQTFQRPLGEVSLEHILPKSGKNYPRFNEADRQLYLDNLGNHTILKVGDNALNSDKPINIKLQKTFNTEEYQSFPVVSNIEKELINGEWTPESIKNRQEKLVIDYVRFVSFSWENS